MQEIRIEVFYDAQYDMHYWFKKDSDVIENALYVRIRRLRLILKYWFFSRGMVIFIGRMSSIRVLSEM
jgi:hypothetical protein